MDADDDAAEKIKLGFDKKYANDRKQWLLDYNPNDVKNHFLSKDSSYF